MHVTKSNLDPDLSLGGWGVGRTSFLVLIAVGILFRSAGALNSGWRGAALLGFSKRRQKINITNHHIACMCMCINYTQGTEGTMSERERRSWQQLLIVSQQDVTWSEQCSLIGCIRNPGDVGNDVSSED
jgi:hypothetical protein